MDSPSLLIVDDEPNNFDVLEALLDDQQYRLYYAASGEEAMASLTAVQPDLILLDVMMPGIDGIEVCKRIKALPTWQSVPIIMVTALDSKEVLAHCLQVGADDFISKPVSRLELVARVRSMLRIRQQHQQLTQFNNTLEDLVQQRTAQLHTMVVQDALTRLPSRTRLLETLTEISQTGRSSFAIIYLDCDQFKLVNGSFGHTVGDQLLVAIAERLQQHLRHGDMLARVGEDEFCFLLSQVENEAALESFIQAILHSFTTPFLAAECEIFMTACMGVALGNHGYQHPEELLQNADTAMYKAKLRGKGSYQIFDEQLSIAMLNRLTLENDLQRALERQEFVNYYQPIFNLQTGNLDGFEALVRWRHPDRGLVSPGEFIPCMEETGLIVGVGLLVLTQACQQLQAWHHQGWPQLTMGVNLSTLQFACPTLLDDIDQVLTETGVNPARLKLEITESAIMDNAPMAIAITEQLRSRQIQISIDDFGTGYSSLGYLHQFPIDTLKIDRSFISQSGSQTRNSQVVNIILALSHQLGLTVVAEGIETTEQCEWLKQLGCQWGQGYLFSKPLAAADIERTFFQKH